MRQLMLAWLVLALFLLGLGVSRAAGSIDEFVVTGQVMSADHEAEEGYFALGQTTMLVVKPGSELHAWLTKQKGRQVRVTLTVNPDSDEN